MNLHTARPDIHHTSLRTSGDRLEMIDKNPCMLSLSKHEAPFFNSLSNLEL
jgi:hypothetical protein